MPPNSRLATRYIIVFGRKWTLRSVQRVRLHQRPLVFVLVFYSIYVHDTRFRPGNDDECMLCDDNVAYSYYTRLFQIAQKLKSRVAVGETNLSEYTGELS